MQVAQGAMEALVPLKLWMQAQVVVQAKVQGRNRFWRRAQAQLRPKLVTYAPAQVFGTGLAFPGCPCHSSVRV